MNYKDTWSWSVPPVEEVPRSEIETLYSLGHYDGPATGLIRWAGELWWVARFDIRDDRFWIIKIDQEHGKRILARSEEWARLFSTACSWTADGKRLPYQRGTHSADRPSEVSEIELSKRSEFYRAWSRENPLEPPEATSEVVGYFSGWSLR